MASKRNKVFQMMAVLSSREEKDFKLVVKNHKRKHLYPLFNLLKKNIAKQELPQISYLYENIYKKKFTHSKEYLIRNELRHLSTELSNYISKTYFRNYLEENALEKDYYLLKALFEKGETELLPIELKKAIQNATEAENYDMLAKLLLLEVKVMVQQKKVSFDAYPQLLTTINEASTNLKRAFVEDFTTNEKFRAFLEKTLHVMKQQEQVKQFEEDILNEQHYQKIKTSYLYFQQLKVNIYAFDGMQKIALLQKMIPLMDKITHPEFNKTLEKVYVYILLGTEYMLLAQYEKALNAHEKVQEEIAVLDNLGKISHILNYVSTLTYAQKYQKAIDTINTFKQYETISGYPIFKIRIIQTMCYLFLNKVGEAEECIPHQLVNKNIKLDYFYYRLVQAVIFYANKEILLAQNEVKNLISTIDYNHQSKVELRSVCAFYNHFFQLLQNKSILKVSDFKEKIQQLIAQLKEFTEQSRHHRSFLANYLLIALQKQL